MSAGAASLKRSVSRTRLAAHFGEHPVGDVHAFDEDADTSPAALRTGWNTKST
jgi:hypothetical protein